MRVAARGVNAIAAPAQVVGSDHTGFEAFEERLDVGDAGGNNAEVLHDLITQDNRPQIVGQISCTG